MQYISPVRFFESLHIVVEVPCDVRRLQKLVNLEFLHSETGIVSIDGFYYNKHDLLQLLSDGNFEQNWQHHLTIWENKQLLELLERTDFSEPKSTDISQLQDVLICKNHDGFVHFVSPYFAPVFNKVSKTLLLHNAIGDLSVWMKAMIYVEPENEETALNSLRLFFDNALYFFRNINAANYKEKLTEIRKWNDSNWSSLLNVLPDYLFQYRDSIARGVTHVLVEIQYDEIYLCCQISNWLIHLNGLSDSISHTIRKNHLIYHQNSRKKRQKSQKKILKVCIGVFLLSSFVAVLLILSGPNKSSRSNNPFPAQTKDDFDDWLSGVSYTSFPTVYYFVHGSDSIDSIDGLDTVGLYNFPLFFSIYEGKNEALKPFRFWNKTDENLLFLFNNDGKMYSVKFGKDSCLLCYPSGNRMMNFMVAQSRAIADTVLWANGTQTTALSIHTPSVVRESDDTLQYKTPHNVANEQKNIDNLHEISIQLTKKNNRYFISASGDSIYYLPERKIMAERKKNKKN